MTAPLYTPEILALAVSLADYPLDTALPLQSELRSKTCGSMVRIGLDTDNDHITRIGIKASACALGQASAALFAQSAIGQTPDAITETEAHLAAALAGHRDWFEFWPGITALAPATAYPARHPSILLPFRAALLALDTVQV